MTNYIAIQNQVLNENPDVRINPASTCWKRTHAHCRKSDAMFGTVCKWKQADSYASTWVLFHEIGHVRTHKASMTRSESESAATRWGIEQMRRSGLPIKRRQLREYKDYIGRTYQRGLRRGLSRRIKSALLM